MEMTKNEQRTTARSTGDVQMFERESAKWRSRMHRSEANDVDYHNTILS